MAGKNIYRNYKFFFINKINKLIENKRKNRATKNTKK